MKPTNAIIRGDIQDESTASSRRVHSNEFALIYILDARQG